MRFILELMVLLPVMKMLSTPWLRVLTPILLLLLLSFLLQYDLIRLLLESRRWALYAMSVDVMIIVCITLHKRWLVFVSGDLGSQVWMVTVNRGFNVWIRLVTRRCWVGVHDVDHYRSVYV